MLPSTSGPSSLVEFGPGYHGAELHIDGSPSEISGAVLAVDVETDETDRLVGVGVCGNPARVDYFTALTPELSQLLASRPLIGHSVKFDAHILRKAGVAIEPSNLFRDTLLISHIRYGGERGHGLKALAKAELNWTWPAYKDIVGVGKKKLTLDKQPVDLVANYCGMDVLATFVLHQKLWALLSPDQRRQIDCLEMPVTRLLYQMEIKGALVDIALLAKLELQFGGELETLLFELRRQAGPSFNPNSPLQVKAALSKLGVEVDSTNRNRLGALKEVPLARTMLQYREIKKLQSTYVQPLSGMSTLPRVHTEFHQAATVTGRLSSRHPNLQNIPIRTEMGRQLREVFIAPPFHRIVCADYSQIEYRLLAHFSGEPRLLQAFKDSQDLHAMTGSLLGASRAVGKTLNFAAIYGARPKKIAAVAEITEEEAARFLNEYWKQLPGVRRWIQRVRHEAACRRGIRTILGKWIPIEGFDSQDKFKRFAAERECVNYIIQGSAADIIKLAMIACETHGFIPTIQIHDELVFEVPLDGAGHDMDSIKSLMEGVITLTVPLVVDVASGPTWGAAKEAK